MSRTKSLVSMLIASLTYLGCGTSQTPVSDACADEYIRATIRFPGVEPKHYCVANAVLRQGIAGAPFCRVSNGIVGAGHGEQFEISIVSSDDWFAHEGTYREAGFLFVAQPQSDVPPECVDETGLCYYRNPNSCSFTITRASGTVGGIIEGHLTAPCDLNGGEHFGEPYFPTLLEADFRAPLETWIDPSPDAGVPCYDAGVS